MSGFIVQNGEYVTTVQAGSDIQLFANSIIPFTHTEFLFTDQTGREIIRQYVIADIWGNAWLDTKAPKNNGTYYFYPDSANMNEYANLEVTQGQGGIGGFWNGLTTGQKWLVGVGGGVAVLSLVAAVVSASRRK